jgi:hypothetical protein
VKVVAPAGVRAVVVIVSVDVGLGDPFEKLTVVGEKLPDAPAGRPDTERVPEVPVPFPVELTVTV